MEYLEKEEVYGLSGCFYTLLCIAECRERHVFKVFDLYAYFLRRVKNHGAMPHLAYAYADDLTEDMKRVLCYFFLADASRKIVNSALKSMLSYMKMTLPKNGDVVRYLYKHKQSTFRLDERNALLLGIVLGEGRLIFSERERHFINKVMIIDDKMEMALAYLCLHNRHFLKYANMRVLDNHSIMSRVIRARPDLYECASSTIKKDKSLALLAIQFEALLKDCASAAVSMESIS